MGAILSEYKFWRCIGISNISGANLTVIGSFGFASTGNKSNIYWGSCWKSTTT
jgi:hypothetical protein